MHLDCSMARFVLSCSIIITLHKLNLLVTSTGLPTCYTLPATEYLQPCKISKELNKLGLAK